MAATAISRCTTDFLRVFEVALVSSKRPLRPGASAPPNCANLDLMLARQDNIARGTAD
jgi:hypothetical protein